LTLTGFALQVAYLTIMTPVRYEVGGICHQPHDANETNMCNFYDDYYNPLFVILAILVALGAFNVLLMVYEYGVTICVLMNHGMYTF
jgi:hypothetical protein